MKIEDRVFVKTRDFEGMATVLHIEPFEFYSIQVELDNADDDGHRTKRVATHEIVAESEFPLQNESIIFIGPSDSRKYVGEVISEKNGYSFKMGQRYILSAAIKSGIKAAEPANSYNIYELSNMKVRGCMPASMFAIIEPYEPEQEPLVKSVVQIETTSMTEEVPQRQMSFFDLL